MSQTTRSSIEGAQPPPVIAVIEPLERETINRVAWRLMPLLVLGYFCNYIDRMNVGFAALILNVVAALLVSWATRPAPAAAASSPS